MPEPSLQPIAVTDDGLARYLAALTEMLEGGGPALLPYRPEAGLDTLDRPGGFAQPGAPDRRTGLDPDLALVLSTSGSTGEPKRAMLTRAALMASAQATHEVLGGPGQWLLAVPAHHVAGTLVLVRSLLARQAPVLMNLADGFTPQGLADACAWLGPGRRYTSLVPTQLRRVLAHEEATAALAGLDGVLVGGAACPPALLEQARAAGIAVRTTYGSSETCGGCVYDGLPLPGTSVHLEDDGRIALAGPTVALGYLGDPERTAAAFGTDPATGHRRFRTDDLGELDDRGRLRVLGRRDAVIVTGGLKVHPRVVEEAVTALPEVAEAVVLALPDDEWGQAVAVAAVPAPGVSASELAGLRERLRGTLPDHALPRRLLVMVTIPTRGPGKPDMSAVAEASGWQNLR